MQFRGHKGQFFACLARINAEPEAVFHNPVCGIKRPDNAVRTGPAVRVKAGMLQDISCKEHPGMDTVLFEEGNHFFSLSPFAAGQKEAEPGRIRLQKCLGKDERILKVLCEGTQNIKILFPSFGKSWEFLNLRAADSSLHVRRLEVVA